MLQQHAGSNGNAQAQTTKAKKKNKNKNKKTKLGGNILDARKAAHVESLRDFAAKSGFGAVLAAEAAVDDSTDDEDYLVLDVGAGRNENGKKSNVNSSHRISNSWDC